MVSTYEEIYSNFYSKVTDYGLVAMDEDLAKEMLSGFLKIALSGPYVRKLFSSIENDSDVEEITYTMREPMDEASDKDFTEDVIAMGMLVAWLSPRYHSVLNTSQVYSNKEAKWYSQSSHMDQVRQMYGKAQIDLRKYIRDRGWSKEIVSGVT